MARRGQEEFGDGWWGAAGRGHEDFGDGADGLATAGTRGPAMTSKASPIVPNLSRLGLHRFAGAR